MSGFLTAVVRLSDGSIHPMNVYSRRVMDLVWDERLFSGDESGALEEIAWQKENAIEDAKIAPNEYGLIVVDYRERHLHFLHCGVSDLGEWWPMSVVDRLNKEDGTQERKPNAFARNRVLAGAASLTIERFPDTDHEETERRVVPCGVPEFDHLVGRIMAGSGFGIMLPSLPSGFRVESFNFTMEPWTVTELKRQKPEIPGSSGWYAEADIRALRDSLDAAGFETAEFDMTGYEEMGEPWPGWNRTRR